MDSLTEGELMRARLLVANGLAALLTAVGLTGHASGVDGDRSEPFRPQVHYTPAENWINDPNGLVFYKGEYHLFYQYNPEGDQWGNMSWGHAVSKDLVHWKELPVAIPYSEREHIFSGSVVVDKKNTSGFGTRAKPAMVAAYTSWDPVTGIQAQSLAYSTDRGRTWTKYEGNPVLDRGSREFRDPKVFWYEEGGYWVMAVVLAVEHKVQFYRSDDLTSWTHLSDFGPANAVGGVWEMPDLFELPVDGRRKDTKWVLVVNLNPGAIAGGSGAQYFIGDFDGTRFTAENVVTENPPPPGTVFEDFEEPTYAPGWTTTGTAFGTGPARGTLPGQMEVSGYQGHGLVNSFVDFDNAQGTLTSPAFTITQDYINFLVGGGAHQWSPEAGDGTPPAGTVFADFEGDFDGWTASGNAFGDGPEDGNAPCQGGVTGYVGDGMANSFHNGTSDPCNPPPDSGTGALVSPDFTITEDYINFLVGGGPHANTAVRLFVDGVPEPVRSTSGNESGTLRQANWDVSQLVGQTAHIEILDGNSGGWGHVMADHFVFSDRAAQPRSTETSVNLVVDGEVVRNASGAESERLDWVDWDVRDLIGEQAQIQIVDRNSGGWGHILADHIMFSDQPARSMLERYDWLDYGKDFYAALSFENVPGDKRLAIAWMNNWQYAGATPTSPWRGSMSLPREYALETIDGEVRLVQQPAQQVRSLRGGGATYRLNKRVIRTGVTNLPDRADGTLLEIEAEFEFGTADEFGLHVRGGDGQRTVIGYDVDAQELFVDRTASGLVGFHPAFPGVHAGPLTVEDGRVRMKIYVDRSSVEVFGGEGQTVITDLVFPDLTSDEVSLYAEGGDVTVRSLSIRPLRSIWR
jgi:levanase